jgi:16S rRNA (guanine(966)-N(2))-methyltransferase RsmD
MRVIAGSRKGIALRCGRGPQFRPTAQVVRGSIFDTLGTEVEGADFLDLFAGSGAVGIEALSRGARRAIFVEQDRRILKALRTNLHRCGFSGGGTAEVRIGDAMRHLAKLIAHEGFFDIVFADPPYASGCSQEVVERIETAQHRVCRLLVIEHGQAVFHDESGPLEKLKTRKFGQLFVSYYRCGEA